MSANQLIIGNKNYSSWSLRAWLAVRRTPLVFTERRLWLDTPGFYAKIAALSPSGRVPALHLDGEVIWDSLAIGETLAERYPDAGLLPAAAGDRARMRCVVAEMHAGFAALRCALPFNCRARNRRVTIDTATAADIARITDIWRDCLSRRSGSGGLFGGFTLADAMYAPVALRFQTYGVGLDEVCAGYLAFIAADPSVREWLDAAGQEEVVIEGEEVGVQA